MLKKVENIVPWTHHISDINGEVIVGTFYEKQLKERNKKEFRVEKVIKRKRYHSNVKWGGYNNFFKSCIDKKDIL